ncbi:HNH endonuclease [Stutzerimonas stutzeri]|uniref:HNH endonuclease n=1 Tax=Stutzerimonas stutzeri TaxID=316 RepID=UPI003D317AF7
MSKINSFGLSRYIPAHIALEVRQRSKFGCVHCRCAISQYEHIDPLFAEAKEHDPDNICLLCGSCHDAVTRGRLSKARIKTDYLQVQKSESTKPPSEAFDLSSASFSVSIGSSSFRHSKELIQINGENILSITEPIAGAAFPTLNGRFYDRLGRESFRIEDNIWYGHADSWDIEIKGKRTIIKMEEGRTALEIEINPPDEIKINKLDMYKDTCHLVVSGDQLEIGQFHGGKKTYIGLANFHCVGANMAIAVDSRNDQPPYPTGLRMAGGEGIVLEGTGIRVGVGAGQMRIGYLSLNEIPTSR